MRAAAATAQAELGIFELRLIAQVAIAGVPYYDKTVLLTLYTVDDIEDLQKQVGAMSENQLKTLLLDCALVRNVRTHPHNKSEEPEPMLAAARQYGLDVAAVRKACKAEMASAAAAEKKETLTKCDTDAEVTA